MFGGVLLFCQVLVVAITSIFQFDVPAGMGIVVVMAALSYPVSLFVKTHERVFIGRERVSFANMTSVIGLLVTGALALLSYYMLAMTGEANSYQIMLDDFSRETGLSGMILIAGLSLLALALTWILAYIETGWFARRVLKGLSKAK